MSLLYDLSTYNEKNIWDALDDGIGNGEFEVKSHNDYLIVKYNKSKLNISNYKTLGLWRSVILNKKTKQIVSFCPPKSLPWFEFTQNNKPEECKITNFEEGTMINLFYDKDIQDWEISTKSSIGGRYKYFQESPKTFRFMFLEAMNYTGMEFDMLNPSYCYSFVLQHPDNRIVVLHKKMKLILTNIYQFRDMKVYEQPISIHYTSQNESRTKDVMEDIITPLQNKYSKGFSCDSWEKIFNDNQRMDIEYTNVGIQVYNTKTGHRTKLRNPSYEKVKFLKGNSPKLQFQYYNLRQADKVKEFLKYYPEYRGEFLRLRDELHRWTRQLFSNYRECFIRKHKPLREFAYHFKPHMFRLHKLYLEELRTEGNYVSMSEVINYVNNLHPAKLMYSINYPHRKNTTDIIKNSSKINNVNQELDV
tara:strand:+ start:162 stop:1415 length:1254 start_codon:yes stop_codon:yes gene_type:complete